MNNSYIRDHLLEAHEELESILEALRTDLDYDIGRFVVQMEHLYYHLNTAWNAKSATDEQLSTPSAEDSERWSRFPTDLLL